MNKRNTTIEFFKYLAALMVVAIHTASTFGTDSNFGFFVINIMFRLAVPFFAVCSGYFLSVKYESNSKELLKKRMCKQIYKICKLYGVWSLIYLIYSIPLWIRTGWFSKGAFVDFFIGSVISGAHYHLWYILSLLYALPLYWLALRFIKYKWFLPISILLWFVKVLGYGYRWLLPDDFGIFYEVLDKYSGIRDAIFLILPLMFLGAYIRFEKDRESNVRMIGFILSFMGLCVEAFWLKSQGQYAVSYIVFTYPVAYFLFLIILKIKEISWRNTVLVLGNVSMFVYCVHPIIVELLNKRISGNMLCFLITAILSTTIGLIVFGIKEKMRGVNNV